jgi:hypothetical protein
MKFYLKIITALIPFIHFLTVADPGVCAQVNNQAKSKITDSGNGIYTFQYSNIEVVVNSNNGGRIISLKVDGKELLVTRELDRMSYGSTFWPSPQADWNWPPPSALDSKPYEAKINGNILEMTSNKDERLGLQLVKKISISEKDTSVVIDYTIKNSSDKPRKVAPWEISRMPKGGIAFFPKGKSPFGLKNFDPVPYVEKDNIVWYKSNKEEVLKNHQLTITDGSEGWLAYLRDGSMLVKKFEDIEPKLQAPGEGEVIIYVNPEKPMIEVEAEGPYSEIKPDGNVNWVMKWYPRAYKEDVKDIGDKKLVQFVRNLFVK